MDHFEEWRQINEDVPPSNDIALTGRLGRRSGAINTLNRRIQQPMNRMNDNNRINYLANMISAVYNQMPPEERAQAFTRDMVYIRPKILKAIQQSAQTPQV